MGDKEKKVEKNENVKTEETKKVEKKESVKKEEPKKTEKKENVKKEEPKKVENTKKQTKEVKGKVTVENKKSNKKGMTSLIIIIALAILAVVLYMFFANTPKRTVEGMLQSLKTGNYENVNKYINYNELISSSQAIDGENLNEDAQKLFFDKLSWKITEEKQENDVANITVEVTNKNFKTIINNCMQKIFKVALSGGNINNEETEKYLIEELNNENVEMTTTTQTIILNIEKGKWIITTPDEELIKILLPGLNEVVDLLG